MAHASVVGSGHGEGASREAPQAPQESHHPASAAVPARHERRSRRLLLTDRAFVAVHAVAGPAPGCSSSHPVTMAVFACSSGRSPQAPRRGPRDAIPRGRSAPPAEATRGGLSAACRGHSGRGLRPRRASRPPGSPSRRGGPRSRGQAPCVRRPACRGRHAHARSGAPAPSCAVEPADRAAGSSGCRNRFSTSSRSSVDSPAVQPCRARAIVFLLHRRDSLHDGMQRSRAGRRRAVDDVDPVRHGRPDEWMR